MFLAYSPLYPSSTITFMIIYNFQYILHGNPRWVLWELTQQDLWSRLVRNLVSKIFMLMVGTHIGWCKIVWMVHQNQEFLRWWREELKWDWLFVELGLLVMVILLMLFRCHLVFLMKGSLRFVIFLDAFIDFKLILLFVNQFCVFFLLLIRDWSVEAYFWPIVEQNICFVVLELLASVCGWHRQ